MVAEDRREALGGIDAVLQRDHRGFGADQRPDRRAGALDVPQLDAEQHDVDRSDECRIVGRLCRS